MSDIVKLKNGSMMRGTITELLVGDHVEIRLVSGETRRVPMQDVDYAGPEAAATPPSPPASSTPEPAGSVRAEKVDVHLVANEPGVELHTFAGQMEITSYGWTSGPGGGAGNNRQTTITGTAKSYLPVCTAPCDASLPKGTQRLALSYEGGKPVDVTVVLAGPSRLEADYTSRRGIRVGGLVLFSASFLTGAGLTVYGVQQGNGGPVGIGVAVALLGGLSGLVLMLIQDSAQIGVVPQRKLGQLQIVPTVLAPRYEGASRAAANPLNGAGLALRYSF